MSDGVIVLVTLTLKPEAVASFISGLPKMFAESREHKGFRTVSVHRGAEDPNKLVIMGEWESVEDQQDYVRWRAARGDMAAIGAAVAAPPQIDIWEKHALVRV